jgi:hypothetical protein
MANPNLFYTQSIIGKTSLANVTTTSTTLITNSADSNTIVKVNSVILNNSSNNDITARVHVDRGGSSYYIAYDITVPPRATILTCGRDHSFYLEESDVLKAVSSSDTGVSVIVGYDILG